MVTTISFLLSTPKNLWNSVMTIDRNWLEDKVEPVARMLAAEKMGLTKDVYGENQKYELWSQCIPEAHKYLGKSSSSSVATI